MRLPVKARHLPPRMVTGAFILNAGLGKWHADEERAARLHGFAVGTYPFLAKAKAGDFAKLPAAAEITPGSALLLPFVPSIVAGAGLAAFTGGLLGLSRRPPGTRQPRTAFPGA